jgi:hypothetical protein
MQDEEPGSNDAKGAARHARLGHKKRRCTPINSKRVEETIAAALDGHRDSDVVSLPAMQPRWTLHQYSYHNFISLSSF